MATLEGAVASTEVDDVEQDLSALRDPLLELLSSLDVVEVLAAHEGPVRLINALRNGLAPGLTLAQALADPGRFSAAVMRWPSLGRRSAVDAEAAFRRGVVAHISRLGWPEPVGRSAFDLLMGAAPENVDLLRRLVAGERPPEAPNGGLTAEAILSRALGTMRDRERDIVTRRFGLGGRRQTLEEIGDDYRVTRERIRQIEAKALRKLRARHRPDLQIVVREFGGTAWSQISDGRASIVASTLSQTPPQLCPWFLLALVVCGSTLAEWLDDYAQRWKQGWAAPWLAPETLEAIDSAIVTAQAERRLPCALECVAPDDPDLIAAVVRLQPGMRVYGGYVVAQRLGPRLRRVLGVHAILGQAGRPLEPERLLAEYRAAFPGDDCTFRDIELVVASWPRLFLEVTEGVWTHVGRAAPFKSGAHTLTADAEVIDADYVEVEAGDEQADEDTLTLAGALEAELRRVGPMRLGDILERAPSILPPGRSVNSVGPTLLLYKDRFVRGLPGLYGLVGQLPADEALLVRPPPSYLLQDDVVRSYVLARRAGEGFGAFPLWRPATEVVWCEWARQEADTPLFESLMSVVRPDLWPVDGDRRGAWSETAKARGAFCIGFQPNPASVTLPPLDRVMAALRVVTVEGSLGWTRANRILMRRMRDHQAAGLLAVLTVFGAIEPGEDWQAPHLASGGAAELLSALDNFCAAQGRAHWETEIGDALLARLRCDAPRGWVTEEILSRIVSRWVGFAELPAQLLGPPLSPLEQLLREQAVLDRAERFDGLLRDIAEDDGA